MTAASERRLLSASSLDDDDRFGEEWRRLAGRQVAARDPRRPAAARARRARRRLLRRAADLHRRRARARRATWREPRARRLERSELYEGERTARALSQQLARTGSLLATELEPAAILEEVADQAPALLGADACAIQLVEGDELVVSAAAGRGRRLRWRLTLSVDRPARRRRRPGALAGRLRGRRGRRTGSSRTTRCSPRVTLRTWACRSSGRAGAPGRARRLLAAARGPGGRRRSRRSPRSPRTPPRCSSNAELYQRVALERERSVRDSRPTSPTGSSRSTARARSCSGTSRRRRSPAFPERAALGRTPVEVLQRELASGDEGSAGERLLSIQRGGDEVWLSLTEAVMRDPVGSVSGRIFAFRDVSSERIVEQMKSDLRLDRLARAPRAADVDLRVRRDAARRDVLFGEEERRTFLGYIASEARAADDDRRHAAQRRTARGRRPRRSSSRRRTSGPSSRTRSRASRKVRPSTGTASCSNCRTSRSPLRPTARSSRQILSEPARQRGQVLAGRRDGHGRGASPGGPCRGQGRRPGRGHPRGRAASTSSRSSTAWTAATAAARARALHRARARAAMGGRIWVDSAEGGGSSFVFELPLAEVTEQSAGGV